MSDGTRASAAPAAPASGGDDFDAILAAPPPSTGARERPGLAAQRAKVGEPAAPAARAFVEAAPSLRDFAEHWDLYRDPVLSGTLAGLGLGLLGVFVVLRRAVFVTAAMSQAAGLGVALSFFLAIHAGLEVPPVVVALLLSLLVAASLGRFGRAPRELVVGFAYLAASALAVLVGAGIGQEAHDIAAILFGTAVLVRPEDVALVGAVGALTVAFTVVARRGLLFSGFDPDGARVQGVPVRTLELGLWTLLAAEVAVTTRALGALPVFAFAILPAVGALFAARRAHEALIVAALLGAISGGAGYLAAFVLDLPVGAAQATVAVVGALLLGAAGRLRRA